MVNSFLTVLFVNHFIVLSVNDMRKISEQLIQSHFGRYFREGKIGRVEFLPIIWHAALHNDANGVDQYDFFSY